MPGIVARKVTKMRTALTMPAVSPALASSLRVSSRECFPPLPLLVHRLHLSEETSGIASCVQPAAPSDGTSNMLFPTTMEKPSIMAPRDDEEGISSHEGPENLIPHLGRWSMSSLNLEYVDCPENTRLLLLLSSRKPFPLILQLGMHKRKRVDDRRLSRLEENYWLSVARFGANSTESGPWACNRPAIPSRDVANQMNVGTAHKQVEQSRREENRNIKNGTALRKEAKKIETSKPRSTES